MKKSMIIKSLLGIAVVIVVVLIINMMLNNKETTARQDAADAWKTLLEKQQFADIPSLVTNASITDNDFTEESLVEKYNTIFKGIGAKDIKIANMKVEELKKDHYMMTYTMTLETALGKMASMNYSAPLIENDGNYKIKWNPTLIFLICKAPTKFHTRLTGQNADKSSTKMTNHSQRMHLFIKWVFYRVA